VDGFKTYDFAVESGCSKRIIAKVSRQSVPTCWAFQCQGTSSWYQTGQGWQFEEGKLMINQWNQMEVPYLSGNPPYVYIYETLYEYVYISYIQKHIHTYMHACMHADIHTYHTHSYIIHAYRQTYRHVDLAVDHG
jgi:hypothetical protein